MEAPLRVFSAEGEGESALAEVKPRGARWAWSQPAVLPSESLPPRALSPARSGPPPSAAPAPVLAAREESEGEEEAAYSEWHGARAGAGKGQAALACRG